MSNIREVSVNTYRRNVRDAIEKLDSVDRCFVYAGEFNSPEENNPAVQLQMNKSQVYIDITFGQFIKNKMHDGVDLILNIRFFIAAKNDYNNPKSEYRNESETCFITMHEIMGLLYQNKFGTDAIGVPDPQAMEQLDTGIRNKQRYSVYAFNVTQQINFYKKK